MAFLPSTYRHEWADADACNHAIGAAAGLASDRGLPAARVLLPWDSRRGRPAVQVALRVPRDVRTRECQIGDAPGWQFDLDANTRMEWLRRPGDPTAKDAGGLKLRVVFDRLPSADRLLFDLALPIGAQKHYQPALRPQDVGKGRDSQSVEDRPPEIVGSYAIYEHPALSKIGHIQRQFLQDQGGARRWCEFVEIPGGLAIVMDTAWMGSAERQWPIVLDADYWGYTDVGGTNGYWYYNNVSGTYSPASSGTATTTEVYLRSSTSTGRAMGIYSNDGNPNVLLRQTTGAVADPGIGWYSQSLTSGLSVESGTAYWIGGDTDGASYTKYDTVAGAQRRQNAAYTGSLPNPWTDDTSRSAVHSFRSEYTASGGGDPEGRLVGGKLVGRGLLGGRLVA